MTDIPRRALLRGSAITAVAMAASAPSSSRMIEPHGLKDGLLSGGLIVAADRGALARIAPPVAGQIVYLAETPREGFFKTIAGLMPAGDPAQGLRIASRTPDFYYERIWDGTHGRPEWFGAVPNDGNVDCADGIEACYALCPVTELSQADYFVRRTVRLAQRFRTLRGTGNWADDQGQGSRIILHSAAPGIHRDDVIVLGAVDKPAVTASSYSRENFVSNLMIVRDGACTPHPSGDLRRYPTGLRISYVFRGTVHHVTVSESSVGIYVGGTVYTKIDDCSVMRSRPGTSRERDFWVGYFIDGRVKFDGFPGGNASLYMNRCVAVGHHQLHADPIGLLAKGAFVDTFIDNFESALIPTGMVFAVDGARAYAQTIDTHIRAPILDGCTRYGINIDLDGTATAAIDIIDPYVAMAPGSPGRGIAVQNGAGQVTITGGQILNDPAGGSLYLARTFGTRVQGLKIMQAARPVVVEDTASLVIEPQIHNLGTASPHYAISARKLVRSIVRPTITGWEKGGFRGGVSLDAESHHNAIDGSAINPDCFTTPDPRFKAVYNGADARGGAGGGAFAAAGNRLVGVTD